MKKKCWRSLYHVDIPHTSIWTIGGNALFKKKLNEKQIAISREPGNGHHKILYKKNYMHALSYSIRYMSVACIFF